MFRELDHLSNSVRILVSHNAAIDERLYEASDEFLAALKEPDQWPTETLQKARSIEYRLTAKGNAADTINGMDVVVAEEIAEEIFDLFIQTYRLHCLAEMQPVCQAAPAPF